MRVVPAQVSVRGEPARVCTPGRERADVNEVEAAPRGTADSARLVTRQTLRSDDHDEPAGIAAAGERLRRDVELLGEPHAERFAARRVVDLRLQIAEARRPSHVDDAVRQRLYTAREHARVHDVTAAV